MLTENIIILLMIVSLFLNPVRDLWSRKMRVAAIDTSATALKTLIDLEIGKMVLSWVKSVKEYLYSTQYRHKDIVLQKAHILAKYTGAQRLMIMSSASQKTRRSYR